jgi:hypothetical protein
MVGQGGVVDCEKGGALHLAPLKALYHEASSVHFFRMSLSF